MARSIALIILLSVLLIPGEARAQRRGGTRGGTRQPMSVDGPVYNPALSPEWRQAGGNPMIYQQIMQQKYLAAQQKQMQKEAEALRKQQQAYEKWLKEQKAKKDKGQPVDPAYQQMLDQEAQYKAAVEARAARAAAKKAKKSAPAKKAAKAESVEKTEKAETPAEKSAAK